MKISKRTKPEPRDVLFRIKRGLSGYVSYLAACEMNEAFSEYILYEPILRILTSRGYVVESEVECPGIDQPPRGDRKRIDFVAKGHSVKFALEVKWTKTTRLNIERDTEKLLAFRNVNPASHSFLCVFGIRQHVEKIKLLNGCYKERGTAVIAEFRKTKYGCRIFELQVGLRAPDHEPHSKSDSAIRRRR